MDEIAQPVVITAIADAEFEGMVSSALFSRGWNVIARPLDTKALEQAAHTHIEANLLIIYSVDLPGLNRDLLQRLKLSKVSTFGFADETGSARGFDEISLRPRSTEELISYIRGNIRSPLLRSPLIRNNPTLKARVIGVGGAGHSTGATTLAINLAQELALLNRNTLLIDANLSAPAISTLLDLRNLAGEDKWRDLSPNFSVTEVTQHNVTQFSERAVDAASYFDSLVLDLGSLSNISSDLSDRRWSSQVKIWSSTYAQELLITAGSDVLQSRRLNEVSAELGRIKLPAKIKIYCQGNENKSKEDNYLSLPVDARSCAAARKDRTTLVEISEKAPLRRAIATMAKQITGALQS